MYGLCLALYYCLLKIGAPPAALISAVHQHYHKNLMYVQVIFEIL